MVLQVILFFISVLLTFLFFLYGFNQYYLLVEARRYRQPPLPQMPYPRPPVAIHLPVYNEQYVVRRVVEACSCMAEAYGKDLVRIMVLDDSDDETVAEIDRVVDEYCRQGYRIEILRRGNRDGYKAGALQVALTETAEEFIAIFDADFVPTQDFLIKTIPYFSNDQKLGIVQSRWTHLNKGYNLLTGAISHAIDVHFLIDQPGRYVGGYYQNFNGSGGVLRRNSILAAGGWQSDTLAEDLDLSYRMQSKGFHILYLRDLMCPGEIPPTVPSYKQQQGRWANGSLRNARKMLPGVLADRNLPTSNKWQAFIHLTGYMIHPLMVLSFLMSVISVITTVNNPPLVKAASFLPEFGLLFNAHQISWVAFENGFWFYLLPFIFLCSLAPWISLFNTLKFQSLPFFRSLPELLTLLVLSFGISLGNMNEAGKALFTNRSWEFVRTPKYAQLNSKQDLQQRKYQVPLRILWVVELVFVLLGIWASVEAITISNLAVLFILVPFTISYTTILMLSVVESHRVRT